MLNRIIALDVGTTESAYCIINKKTYTPLLFGKILNEDLLNIVKSEKYDTFVYEEFQSYGMPIGYTTMQSILWNGRYIQIAVDRGIGIEKVARKEEKMNICGSMKAKDSNIRQALIDRFGVVGTIKEKGFFYGFKKDIWSAYAVGITYLDRIKGC